MWQVPALSIAAQAFLLTLTLSESTEPLGRVIGSLLGLLAAVATTQLLFKHRYYEELYGHVVDRCREVLGQPRLYRDDLEPIALMLTGRSRLSRWRTSRWRRRLVVELSSVRIWIWVFGAFAVADAVLAVLGVLGLLSIASPLSG